MEVSGLLMSQPLYPWGIGTRHPWDGREGEPQIRTGRSDEEKNPIIIPPGKWTPVVHPAA